jgi:hypothetical protein
MDRGLLPDSTRGAALSWSHAECQARVRECGIKCVESKMDAVVVRAVEGSPASHDGDRPPRGRQIGRLELFAAWASKPLHEARGAGCSRLPVK